MLRAGQNLEPRRTQRTRRKHVVIEDSHVQKSVPMYLFRKRAALVFPEDAVAVAGDEFVSPVAQGSRTDAENRCDGAPESAQGAKYGDYGIRAGFGLGAGGFNNVDGIELIGIEVVEESFGIVALQRGEPEASGGVALEDELHQAVAESADAVVEEDGIRENGHGRIIRRVAWCT